MNFVQKNNTTIEMTDDNAVVHELGLAVVTFDYVPNALHCIMWHNGRQYVMTLANLYYNGVLMTSGSAANDKTNMAKIAALFHPNSLNANSAVSAGGIDTIMSNLASIKSTATMRNLTVYTVQPTQSAGTTGAAGWYATYSYFDATI